MSYFERVRKELFQTEISDNLIPYYNQFHEEEIKRLREKLYLSLFRKHWKSLVHEMQSLTPEKCNYDLGQDAIFIDVKKNQQRVNKIIQALIPWRRGPFRFGETLIDAEWQAQFKWNRLKDKIDNLENKNVLDIGSENGYYTLKMLSQNPRIVYAIDPSERAWFQFHLIQNFIQNPKVHFDLFGVENVDLFPDFFNVVFCMGIIYHQRSPIEMLVRIKSCMQKNGLLVLESMAIPGEDEMALCVPDRYAKMHNVYFMPTASAMVAWMKKAKYKDIEIISISPTNLNEQRKTDFAPWESLEEFLDANDKTKTVEGYPAPIRVAVIGRKS